MTKVFVSFAQAFRKKESKTEDQVDSSNEECFLFEVTMEIKEKSSETNSAVFELVPRQKGIFKLRSNIEKKVVVSVQQLSQNSCKLSVERCFGMLVSPGRNGKSKFKRSQNYKTKSVKFFQQTFKSNHVFLKIFSETC